MTHYTVKNTKYIYLTAYFLYIKLKILWHAYIYYVLLDFFLARIILDFSSS
jgi:hypothetical protein